MKRETKFNFLNSKKLTQVETMHFFEIKIHCRTFTLCLVGVKTGRMENRGRKIGWKMMFSTVWLVKENGEEGKPWKKFSLPSPHFWSSIIGRKRLERKLNAQHFFTNALSFPMITASQQRRRRQFSNHQLSTTQLSPPQPKPAKKVIPNPNQNQ